MGTDGCHAGILIFEALKENEFDLALIDLNYARETTSGKEGLDLLAQLRVSDISLPLFWRIFRNCSVKSEDRS